MTVPICKIRQRIVKGMCVGGGGGGGGNRQRIPQNIGHFMLNSPT